MLCLLDVNWQLSGSQQESVNLPRARLCEVCELRVPPWWR